VDRWLEMELFVRTAESESLTKAAESMRISVSAASRLLKALEERLGVRLIQRTTRQQHLTSEGEHFLGRCKDLLSGMREAEASVSTAATDPTGLLRITASLSFCMVHLEPVIREFNARFPNIMIEVVASNRYYDLIENGFDLAIRAKRVEADSSITVRRLAETRRLVAASPAYLEAHGIPRSPCDLKHHKMVLYNLTDNWNKLQFRRGEETVTVPVTGVLSANEGQLIRLAALGGLGILAQPSYVIADDLAAGRLVRLLDDWDLPRLTIDIAFPTRAHMPAKTRLFIDFLIERFRNHHLETQLTS
jgi:DNA-binding transcriptional LysR family regulator